MNAHVRASELASFLTDVQEEFSPSKLEVYTSEVRDFLPESACADLKNAVEQLTQAQASIRKAASRLGYASFLEGLHL